MGQVYEFKTKKLVADLPAYSEMDTLELLDHMVKFQEERSRIGHLTPNLISKGKALFKELHTKSVTYELKTLCRSYLKHLAYEEGRGGPDDVA